MFNKNNHNTRYVLIAKERAYQQTMGQVHLPSFKDFKLLNLMYCQGIELDILRKKFVF
jgi:hypothetical protein